MKQDVLKRVSFVDSTYESEEEESIRNSLQRVLSLMDNTHVHKAHLDASGVYLGWDSMSRQMFGYEKEDVVGKMHVCNMFACIEDYDQVWRIVRDHKHFIGDMAFRRKDGYIIIVRLAVTKEYDEDGDIKGYLVSAVDRADERRLEHQIEDHLVMMAGN